MTHRLSRGQHVRLISGRLPFALPAARLDLLLTDDECKVAWRLRLLQLRSARCVHKNMFVNLQLLPAN